MDIEQLKLVLETLQGLGQETSNLAVIWLALTYGTKVLGWLLATGVVIFVVRVVYRAHTATSDEVFFQVMRDKLGTGTRGLLTDRELAATQDAISVLVTEHITNTRGGK